VRVESFARLGVPPNTPDADLWRLCQTRQILLITGNRNEEGPASLEATLQASNTLTSLPVLTLSEEIGRVKALREPAVDRRQQLIGLGPLALALPQPRQAHGRAQFPPRGLLAAGYVEGPLEAGSRSLRLWNSLSQQELPV
jgi:hypothetical protein